MITLPLLFTVNNKTSIIQSKQNVTLVQDLNYLHIDPELMPLYQQIGIYTNLICPIHIDNNPRPYILIKKWGLSFAQLSTAQLESYVSQSWLPVFLNVFVKLEPYLPQLDFKSIHFKHKQDPKFLPIKICSKQQYLIHIKDSINHIFSNFPKVTQRNNKNINLNEFKLWLQQLEEKRQGLSIPNLMELKMMAGKGTYRIAFSEQQKQWVFSQTGQNQTTKLELVYDGLQKNFDPAPLLKIVQKQPLLFLIETLNNNKVAFWMAAKVQINPANLFGQYYSDKSKKSLLLGFQKHSVHHLQDQNNSVGFGNEILMAIGKTDIILSAFNCSNVSYFPCSYQEDPTKGVNSSQHLLGKQFILKQFEAYRIT